MDMEQAKKQHSWDQYFMGMAQYVATRAKDPSTKVGAVIVGPDHRIRSTGYNGLPAGVKEKDERYEIRELKIAFTTHAEANAIYGAARTGVATDGCTIYVYGLSPCSGCAQAIIQAGITRVCVNSLDIPQRWESSMLIAQEMLSEANIELYLIRPGA